MAQWGPAGHSALLQAWEKPALSNDALGPESSVHGSEASGVGFRVVLLSGYRIQGFVVLHVVGSDSRGATTENRFIFCATCINLKLPKGPCIQMLWP